MKRFSIFLGVLVFLFSTVAISFAQVDPEVTLSADAGFFNKYVWRGLTLTDGPVLQPSATIGVGSFSFNFWGNIDLDDVNNNEYEFNEIDLTAEYGFSVDKLSIAVGVVNYQFPNTDFDSTIELYATVGLETMLNPSVTIYQDIDLVEGTYLSFSAGHSMPIEGTDGVIDVSANLGYGTSEHNLFYYGVEENAFTDLLISGSLSFSLTDYITLSPGVAFSMFMDDMIKDNFEDDSTFIFGVTASFSFE